MMDARRREFETRILPLQKDLAFAAAALCGNTADTQDLVQEALMKAWNRFETFTRDDNLKAWLVTILRNTYIDRCRKRRLEPVSLDPSMDPGAAPAPDPKTIEDALPEDLVAALQSLSPAHRLVLQLVDIEGLSYKQAAEAMGCPIGSIMSGLFNARTQLRRKLEAGGSKPEP